MSGYVLGMDAGATKSHLALFDTTGSFVDFDRWGPLNHETLPGSFAQFEDELGQFVMRVLSRNGITLDQVSYSVFGLGGVDTKKQHCIVSEILKKRGFKRFTLANDAFLGVFAGSPAGTGICAINGSGCTLAGINKEGKMFQIGGVGYISADYGGGGMMGEKAVSAVYSELFRRGEPTRLTPALFNKLGITVKYDFVERIYEKTDDGSFDAAACAKMLFEAVIENDRVAAGILRDIAASYASGISCMIEEMRFDRAEEINIVLAGSVFVKSEHPLLLDTIREKVTIDNPDFSFKFTRLDVPPVAGAVIWALNMLNEKGVYDTVRSRLREPVI